MYRDVRMAHQKVCKQGRYDIKVKVNIQSSIPTSFYSTELSYEKHAGILATLLVRKNR